MRTRLLLPLACSLALSIGGQGAATILVPINGLFNTGVSTPGTPIANDATDAHWTVNGGAAFANARNGVFPTAANTWLLNTNDSRWLGPTKYPTSGVLNNVPGDFTYQLNFTITPLQLANTARFTARIASDNATTSILLNGNVIAVPTGVNFKTWTGLSVTSGFVAGLNTIKFKINNGAGASGNPTGFRAEFLTSQIEVLPEPGTWAMLVIGFGLIGIAERRKPVVA